MTEITLTTWEAALYLRDSTYLNLFIIAAMLLLVYSLWIAGRRLAERLTAGLAIIAYMSLLVVGVVQLWQL
ncbi:MAG: hypothetical protein HC875_16965 [Anaerolineales bacterium]|nr:hypothetical protein [Anaerolineales bacterium]